MKKQLVIIEIFAILIDVGLSRYDRYTKPLFD